MGRPGCCWPSGQLLRDSGTIRTHLLITFLSFLTPCLSFMLTKLLYTKESCGRDLLAQLRSGSHLGPITCGQKLVLVVLGYHQQKARRAASEGRDSAEQKSPRVLSRGIWPGLTCILGLHVGIQDESFFSFYS